MSHLLGATLIGPVAVLISETLCSVFMGLAVGTIAGGFYLIINGAIEKSNNNRGKMVWSGVRFAFAFALPFAFFMVTCNILCNWWFKKSLYSRFVFLEKGSNCLVNCESYFKFPPLSKKFVSLPGLLFVLSFYPLVAIRYSWSVVGLKRVVVYTIKGNLLTVVYIFSFYYMFSFVSDFGQGQGEEITGKPFRWLVEKTKKHPFLKVFTDPIIATTCLKKWLKSNKKQEI